MANESETGSLDDLIDAIKGLKDIPESARKDCLEDLHLQKTDEAAWMRKADKRLRKSSHVISARELFGDSDDEEDDSPDSEKEDAESNPEEDFDTFYSDDDEDGEEDGDDENSDDTMGGETIINLNFK